MMEAREAISELAAMSDKDIWKAIIWADEYLNFHPDSIAEALRGGINFVERSKAYENENQSK